MWSFQFYNFIYFLSTNVWDYYYELYELHINSGSLFSHDIEHQGYI